MTYSLVIPVYLNQSSIPRLLQALEEMHQRLDRELEVVFVVDGSPDQSYALLRDALPSLPYPAQLLGHSRNFGSFPAVRSGLLAARGRYFAVMAADLQEPPELILDFFRALKADECDVAIGTRNSRNDPPLSRLASSLFWGLYRRVIAPEMPEGGVDVFGCDRAFRDQLLQLEESRSSLIALIFWLGFRRKLVGYDRRERQEGKSSWTLRKRIDYMRDSIFAFSDLPIRLLMRLGVIGSALSLSLGAVIILAKLLGVIQVPGYAATMLAVLCLGALNLLGLGLVGTYAWRAYENSKQRPLAIVSMRMSNHPPREPEKG
ncbi:glycosyltransferase family 2 protein [Desulfarculus baarsii]|uniref:glycosyltransferase family 2 protein n=1 Tax=Desulfarculus baarsii TaxID=453230 RepID=UPI0005C1FD27